MSMLQEVLLLFKWERVKVNVLLSVMTPIAPGVSWGAIFLLVSVLFLFVPHREILAIYRTI